jgi:DNA polymerase sigma
MEKILARLPQPPAPEKITMNPEINRASFTKYKAAVAQWSNKLAKLVKARKLTDKDIRQWERLSEDIDQLKVAIEQDLELINNHAPPRNYLDHEVIFVSDQQEVTLEEFKSKPSRYQNKTFVLVNGTESVPVMHISSAQTRPMNCAFCEIGGLRVKGDMRKHIEEAHVNLKEFEETERPARPKVKMHSTEKKRYEVLLARLSPAQYETLSAEIEVNYEEYKLSQIDINFKQQVKSQVETILQRGLPDVVVQMYGSSSSGFSLGKAFDQSYTSDVDLNISIDFAKSLAISPERYRSLREVFDEVALNEICTKIVYSKACQVLRASGIVKINYISSARVKVMTFQTPPSLPPLSVDVCLNNHLAVANTQLLLTYSQIDYRVPCLGIAVKAWTRRRDISNAKNQTLSSYAYIILLIHYLQRRDSPLLPCLQKRPAKVPSKLIDGHEVYFTREIEAFQRMASLVPDSLGELLLGFFRYYAYFNWDDNIVSIRLPEHYQFKTSMKRDKLTIEDPFELGRNLGDVVSDGGAARIKEEFKLAAYTLALTGSLQEVLKPYLTKVDSR